MPPAPPSSQDVQIGEDSARDAPKIPSFKDKLLNSSEEEDEDIVLKQGDVTIGLSGKIPMVDFTTHVIETLNKKMGLMEDLDYHNALLTGPWMIFGHYLTVQPWTPYFKPHEHVVNQVIGWVRLSKLPARYYHKSIIRSIGGVFGEVIKVDYNTDSDDRGKFARIVVVIDLTKPLTSQIQVDSELFSFEHEGLPSICFDCGKYGHLQDSCPEKNGG
ncbi:hypothetical protein K1719_029446 [Acacia pycnantha]|nr:hypothetical protein K1719_029446 [Acacia pycnantha]